MITREFGLIGYPLSHSFSQKFFTEKFEREGIDDAIFSAFSIPSINDLAGVLNDHPLLKGFAITIPYKREVIPFLDHVSAEVIKMNACNCVHIKDGKLLGDSYIRKAGVSMNEAGENIGCPASEEEVAAFINLLKKTSKLTEEESKAITKRFKQNKV